MSEVFQSEHEIDMAALAGFKAGCHGQFTPPSELVGNELLMAAWLVGNRLARENESQRSNVQ